MPFSTHCSLATSPKSLWLEVMNYQKLMRIMSQVTYINIQVHRTREASPKDTERVGKYRNTFQHPQKARDFSAGDPQTLEKCKFLLTFKLGQKDNLEIHKPITLTSAAGKIIII